MDGSKLITRRGALRRLAAGAACTSVGLGAQLPLMSRALAAENYTGIGDYRSLVCVYLGGGIDTHNAFVPYANGPYAEYAALRQGLAIPRANLLPGTGGALGFHPALSPLRTLFDEGRLALVTNLGNLFEPMTPQQLFDYYETGTSAVRIPHELYSHSHQTDLIQLNFIRQPGAAAVGWGGAIGDRLVVANVNPSFPLSYTVAGTNYWQTGGSTRPFSVQAGQDIPRFEEFNGDSWPPWEPGRSASWLEILGRSHVHPLEAQAAGALLATKQRSDLLRAALAGAPALQTPFNPDQWLDNQLRTVARLISIRQQVGMRRQLFFVELGNWDTHSNHLQQHGQQLAELGSSLFNFQRTLQELGVENSVTTFTFSEFNRTLTINGDGTDHAWAGDQIVMGGAVDGAKVHGTPIQYTAQGIGTHWGDTLFGPYDTGAGRFVPRYSMDQYGATLARWMGIKGSDFDAIFPNLANFTQKDLGFMKPG